MKIWILPVNFLIKFFNRHGAPVSMVSREDSKWKNRQLCCPRKLCRNDRFLFSRFLRLRKIIRYIIYKIFSWIQTRFTVILVLLKWINDSFPPKNWRAHLLHSNKTHIQIIFHLRRDKIFNKIKQYIFFIYWKMRTEK